MENNVPSEATIREYLLGRLEADAALVERIDELMLNDPQFSESIDVIEDEIIEQYVDGSLTSEDKKAVESHFLRPPERKEKLHHARLLSRRLSASPPYPLGTILGTISEKGARSPVIPLPRISYMAYVGIGAMVLLLFSLGYTLLLRRQFEAELDQKVRSLIQERERATHLSQQLQAARELAHPATVMLSLVQSSLVRGDAIVPEVRIAAETANVHIEIALPSSGGGEYRVQLEAGGKMIWIRKKILALSSADGAILMFDLPAQVLTAGESRFLVTSKRGDQVTYYFATSKE